MEERTKAYLRILIRNKWIKIIQSWGAISKRIIKASPKIYVR